MAESEKPNEFHAYQRDLDSVGEFIRLYLTRYGRWGSPKYLIGESYGTTRAAGLTLHLQGSVTTIFLNGVMLVSLAIDFQTLSFDDGNELPYPLFLPTYAATAWYHQALVPDLQARPLAEVVAAAEDIRARRLHRGADAGLAPRRRGARAHRHAGRALQRPDAGVRAPGGFASGRSLRYFKQLLRHRGQHRGTAGLALPRRRPRRRRRAPQQTDPFFECSGGRVLRRHQPRPQRQAQLRRRCTLHRPCADLGQMGWKGFENRYLNVGVESAQGDAAPTRTCASTWPAATTTSARRHARPAITRSQPPRPARTRPASASATPGGCRRATRWPPPSAGGRRSPARHTAGRAPSPSPAAPDPPGWRRR